MTHTQKKYYTIGELAAIVNLPSHTIRYWQKSFDFIEPKIVNSRRVFMQKHIDIYTQLKDLIENKGYSLAGAKSILLQKSPVKEPNIALAIQKLDNLIERLS